MFIIIMLDVKPKSSNSYDNIEQKNQKEMIYFRDSNKMSYRFELSDKIDLNKMKKWIAKNKKS